MSVIAAAKRRRTQAANGFKHIAKLGRPIYHKISAEKSARKLAQKIATERRMQQRSKKA
jgi:orotidine-5'-phosphate decarboxylase